MAIREPDGELWTLTHERYGATLWQNANAPQWWAVCPEGLEPQHAASFICNRARAEQEFYRFVIERLSWGK